MYAQLKDNICVGVSDVRVNEDYFDKNEAQVKVEGVEDDFTILGKAYVDGTFIEAELSPEEIQEEKNRKNRSILRGTDWKITRHREQLEMEIATSLTDEEYQALLTERQKARSEVVDIDYEKK
ncbi:MAG: hypothetical protein ACMUJM_17025 [bacterium]